MRVRYGVAYRKVTKAGIQNTGGAPDKSMLKLQ